MHLRKSNGSKYKNCQLIIIHRVFEDLFNYLERHSPASAKRQRQNYKLNWKIG